LEETNQKRKGIKMNKELLKKVKLGVISLSVLGVLVACGDTAEEEPIDDPGVEAPGTPGGRASGRSPSRTR